MKLFSNIKLFCEQVINTVHIPEDRRQNLSKLMIYMQYKICQRKPISLVYLCTHNSRRSHIGQVWAQILSKYFHINDVKTFSGGMQVTEVYQSTLKAFEQIGFKIKRESNKRNGKIKLYFSGNDYIELFSKTYNHPSNPSKNFAAIMTCNDIDQNCPIIQGYDLRLSTPYTDPKKHDDSSIELCKYVEKNIEIASEIAFVFKNLVNRLSLQS